MAHCQKCGGWMYDGLNHFCTIAPDDHHEEREMIELKERELDIMASILQQLINLNRNMEKFNAQQSGTILEVLSKVYGEDGA